MTVSEKVYSILNNMGFYINSYEDINLIDYGMDSIGFVSFIIEIENELEIIIPDEALLIENISSLHGFIRYIDSIVNADATLIV